MISSGVIKVKKFNKNNQDTSQTIRTIERKRNQEKFPISKG